MSDAATVTKRVHLTYGGQTMLCGVDRATGYAEYAYDAPRCAECDARSAANNAAEGITQ
jgi:hypothetical protein